MTEPSEQGGPPEVGWRVLDPDGNVVDSGPGMFLIAAGESGPADDTEEN